MYTGGPSGPLYLTFQPLSLFNLPQGSRQFLNLLPGWRKERGGCCCCGLYDADGVGVVAVVVGVDVVVVVGGGRPGVVVVL